MTDQLPVVVLDPGHGGTTKVGGSSPNNASGPNGLLEKNLTLDVAQRVAGLLRGAAQVLLTRTADTNLGLAARARVAHDNQADVFLSIHFNGFHDPSVDGAETWVARQAGQASRAFAADLLTRLVAVTGAANRGVREQDFGVLLPGRHVAKTAVCLAEIAFLTNPAEAQRLAGAGYLQQIAEAIAAAIRLRLPAPAPVDAGVGQALNAAYGAWPASRYAGSAAYGLAEQVAPPAPAAAGTSGGPAQPRRSGPTMPFGGHAFLPTGSRGEYPPVGGLSASRILSDDDFTDEERENAEDTDGATALASRASTVSPLATAAAYSRRRAAYAAGLNGRLGQADAQWAADAISPDYRHLGVGINRAAFDFTAAHLANLCALNRFDVTSGQDQVIFGLRGCRVVDPLTEATFANSATLAEDVPDHNLQHCVLGIWKRSTGQIAVFTASTVPNWKYMREYVEGGDKCNMLPTGRYRYSVGRHKKLHGAFREADEVVVLRTHDDLIYTTSDEWDHGSVGDNIHPAYLDEAADGPKFSSAGCQTIPGTFADGEHRRAWADFRRLAGLSADSPASEDGREYVYVLLTGREARLAATQLDTSGLARLRFGSSGVDVTALRLGLSSAGFNPGPDSPMAVDTTLAYIAWQKAQPGSGGTADAIVTPGSARALGFDLLAHRSVMPAAQDDGGYFRDTDQLDQMIQDSRSTDHRVVSTRADALAVVDAFEGRTGASPWRSLDRGQVATRLRELINEPRNIRQGGLNLCGPAALICMWAARDPVAFARYATDLYDTGRGRIGRMTVAPSQAILNMDFNSIQAQAGTQGADWMVLGAIRNSTNVWWQPQWVGNPDQTLAGMTRPEELASWLQATGIYRSVRNEANWVRSAGLDHALNLIMAPGQDVALLINVNLMNYATGDPIDRTFILSAFPDHWVVLLNEVVSDLQRRVIRLSLWSWGSSHIMLEVPVEHFADNYYGAIICSLRDDLVVSGSSMSLADRGAARGATSGAAYREPARYPAASSYREPARYAASAAAPYRAGVARVLSASADEAELSNTPVLAPHNVTRQPDCILRWNDIPDGADSVDVVVHFHGYSAAGANMDLHNKLHFSGLDFAGDPDNPGGGTAGRTRPTLGILPRGKFDPYDYRGRDGQMHHNGERYTFGAIDNATGMRALIDYALGEFARRAGIDRPQRGRLIFTAHSGGGAALMRLLGSVRGTDLDPDEVHMFDATYNSATPLIAWAQRRSGQAGGALRVLYLPGTGTEGQALATGRAVTALVAQNPGLADWYRVEAVDGRYPRPSGESSHGYMPRFFGWRLLAGADASLPDVSTPAAAARTHSLDADAGAAESSAACTVSGATATCGSCTATENRLRAVAAPTNLAAVPGSLQVNARGHIQLEAGSLAAFQQLYAAAQADGISGDLLKIVSGYRDYGTQSTIWRGKLLDVLRSMGCSDDERACAGPVIDRTSQALAGQPLPYPRDAWLNRFRQELNAAGCTLSCDVAAAVSTARIGVAPPGSSPHHTGRAVDLYVGVAPGQRSSTTTAAAAVAWQRTQPAYRWLVCNAARFDFYPYNAEPWHWEYNPATSNGNGAAAQAYGRGR